MQLVRTTENAKASGKTLVDELCHALSTVPSNNLYCMQCSMRNIIPPYD